MTLDLYSFYYCTADCCDILLDVKIKVFNLYVASQRASGHYVNYDLDLMACDGQPLESDA